MHDIHMTLQEIRASCRAALFSSGTAAAVESGAYTRADYARLLIDVYNHVRHSPSVIGLAAVRLMPDRADLAEYLMQHAGRMLGHDGAVLADLQDIGHSRESVEASIPSGACTKLLGVAYLYATQLEPVGVFGWLYALDCFGGEVGSELAAALNRCLDLRGRGLRFISRPCTQSWRTGNEDGIAARITNGITSPVELRVVGHVAGIAADLYLEMIEASIQSGESAAKPTSDPLAKRAESPLGWHSARIAVFS